MPVRELVSEGTPPARDHAPDERAIRWLLGSADPSIRYLTRRDLLAESPRSRALRAEREKIPEGPRVRRLLAGQREDGGFGVHPYRKWTGAHWRLVSLVDFGIPAGHPACLLAAEHVLRWLRHPNRRSKITVVNGLARRCASMEGNALGVCVSLGMSEDPRVRALASSLVEWQWPDGGWNCDVREDASHSSFHETLRTTWGLAAYARSTGDADALACARRAAEFFLRHRLFRSERSGEVGDPKWLRLRYPPYWHYDVLQACSVLAEVVGLSDPRAADALDVVESKRLPEGPWGVEGFWWESRGTGRLQEVVDWGRRGPNEMVTLNALRVLRAAGRVSIPARVGTERPAVPMPGPRRRPRPHT
ncbi:MAG: hypothetical protein H0W94_06790, partial [Actinobacteria bacterium]|nr:hypothetical protein [Actinomycetota bacterium]